MLFPTRTSRYRSVTRQKHIKKKCVCLPTETYCWIELRLAPRTPIEVVSSRSLLRFAYSLGYNSHNVPRFTPFFKKAAAELSAGRKVVGKEPQRLGAGLIYLGSHHNPRTRREVHEWGFTLDFFKQFIARIESSPTASGRLGYTEFARVVIQAYLKAVDKALGSSGTDA